MDKTMVKQRIAGVVLAGILILGMYYLATHYHGTDCTAFLLIIPLGLYLIFSKKSWIY